MGNGDRAWAIGSGGVAGATGGWGGRVAGATVDEAAGWQERRVVGATGGWGGRVVGATGWRGWRGRCGGEVDGT